MAIDSVTSTISAYASGGAQASQAQQTQQVQAPEKREPRPEERVERKEEPPRPVVNAQGQQTGTLINVIAFIFFALKGLVIWHLALLMAVGTIIGGYAGARLAKRIDQRYIRAFVICAGLFLSVWLFITP